ncbi:MAG: helix-turn-helix domain-containing protein [Myxococcota bacterium]|nr:helix-turn-helix domain-containing protein [Myxococcota bacterium]
MASKKSWPAGVVDAVRLLGENVATARQRRGLRQVDLAARTGLARLTIRRIEAGHPGTAVGAYFAALWALGLEREIAELASPDRDEEGKTLEAARRPRRVVRRTELDADF